MTSTPTSLTPSLASAAGYAPQSRVWVYTISRPLNAEEKEVAEQALAHFVRQWTAHNQALKATAEIFENQFVVLMVDETQAGASGCSIDKSVHFLEALGHQLNIDFFERMRFAWVHESKLQFAGREELSRHLAEKTITADTLMVNTLVQNKLELQEKWLLPFSQSWHRRLV